MRTSTRVHASASARPPVSATLTDTLPSICLLECAGLRFHTAVCECLPTMYLAVPGQTQLCAAPRRRILPSGAREHGCGGVRGA